MIDASEFEGRRYSAVAVAHSSLRSLNDVLAAVEGMELHRGKPVLEKDGVVAVRAAWRHAQNLYPYGSFLRKSARHVTSDGRYSHHCYIAELASSKSASMFVFASPHIRVVGRWATTLGERLENPKPNYAIPLLDKLFHDLETSSMAYKATQITLQIPSSVDVEKVALTGKSPLISGLRASLESVTRPYAIRLEVPRDKRPLRLHLDRHGNFWWHQANDQAFGVAARALSSLRAGCYFGETHDLPHLRIVSEESYS
jgi:hypothetical protein